MSLLIVPPPHPLLHIHQKLNIWRFVIALQPQITLCLCKKLQTKTNKNWLLGDWCSRFKKFNFDFLFLYLLIFSSLYCLPLLPRYDFRDSNKIAIDVFMICCFHVISGIIIISSIVNCMSFKIWVSNLFLFLSFNLKLKKKI